jgi:hypothetical protein
MIKMNTANGKIHIISHNHWDLEWIFTARYTKKWLIPFFKLFFRLACLKRSSLEVGNCLTFPVN